MEDDKGRIEVMLEYIKRDINDIKETLKADYVRRAEFEPVKKVVFGVVGLILSSVIVALIALVVSQGK